MPKVNGKKFPYTAAGKAAAKKAANKDSKSPYGGTSKPTARQKRNVRIDAAVAGITESAANIKKALAPKTPNAEQKRMEKLNKVPLGRVRSQAEIDKRIAAQSGKKKVSPSKGKPVKMPDITRHLDAMKKGNAKPAKKK